MKSFLKAAVAAFALVTALPVMAQGSGQPQAEALGCQAIVTSVAETGRAALKGVHFDFNRSSLRAESLPALLAARDAINTLGGNWTVEGHTDSIGSHEYNQRLSLHRAQAVADWLNAAGMAGARLDVQGFSFERPIADNTTEEGRARNRRVELVAHNPDFDAVGFGGPAEVEAEGCGEAAPSGMPGIAGADATLPPPTGFQGTGGRDWLEYSSLQPSGRGIVGFSRFETAVLPAGTRPETCQAMCLADSGCAAWSFQPGGAYFVAEASCMRYDYGSELALTRHNEYQEDGGIFVSGFRPDAANLIPETAALADEIIADMAEIAAARATTRLDAPRIVEAGSPVTVGVTGWVLEGDFVEIADFGEWTYYYQGIHARAFHGERDSAGRVTLIAPEPGDYILRYVIDHPRAGRHSVVEHPIMVLDADTPQHPAATPGAVIPPASGSAFGTVEPGIDRPGLDIGQTSLLSANPLACQALCAGDPGCRAWTYVNPGLQGDQAMCWTKFDVPDGHENECCTSGVIERSTATPQEPALAPVLPGPDAAPPYETEGMGEDTGYYCPADAMLCPFEDEATGIGFTLAPGFYTDFPYVYETAGGAVATGPSLSLYRISDNDLVAALNPRQWSTDLGPCFDNTLGQLCLYASDEADAVPGDSRMAFAFFAASLRSLAVRSEAEREPESIAASGPAPAAEEDFATVFMRESGIAEMIREATADDPEAARLADLLGSALGLGAPSATGMRASQSVPESPIMRRLGGRPVTVEGMNFDDLRAILAPHAMEDNR